MKTLLALLTLAALSALAPAHAQEGGRDPFALRTPGVTTRVQPPRPVRPAPVRRVRPAPRPAPAQ